ncbi:MAG: sensor histidine kinase, partial [Spirochaetota bacterium]
GIFGIYAGSTGFFEDEEVSLLDQLAADLGYALEVARTRDAAAAAERERAEWEHLMSFVIEHDPSSIAVYDTEMRYLYVSNKFLNDNGLQKELVIGRRHYDVLPDIPRKWREAHRRALAGEKVHSEDDFYVRADGTVEYNRWDCRPWRRRDGEIGGIILYTEVITRQRLAEGEHRRVLAALRSLLEHSPDLISIVDADGHWVMVSDSVAEVTGVTADEMEGRRFEELIDEGVAARFRARIRKIVEGRHSISELEEIETPEGTRRFRTTLFPAEQAGGAVRLIGIVSTDLTAETRALEDRREAEIAREQVLAQRELTLRESHHRIKNDMQIIEALLSLQAGETADPAAAEVLEEAAGRVEVMTQLYDTIYLHGDPESDTDLAELIPALVHGIGRRYGRRAPDITAEAASISVPNRQAGPIAVIVNELITNAVKHGSSHRPDDLAVHVRVLAEDGTTVVRVSDNGPGIDQAVLGGHSDGFGMTLVRTFAAQLRGSVAMRNNADSGATVDVRF